MAGVGWNTTGAFVDNTRGRFEWNHIKHDGFLKNLIRAGIEKWSNDINHYLDEGHSSTYAYNYNNGYAGGRPYIY